MFDQQPSMIFPINHMDWSATLLRCQEWRLDSAPCTLLHVQQCNCLTSHPGSANWLCLSKISMSLICIKDKPLLNFIHNLINYNTTLKFNILKSCLSCHLIWCLPRNCLIFIHERTLKNKLCVLLSDFVSADVTSQWAIIANKVYGFASVGYDDQLCVIISSKWRAKHHNKRWVLLCSTLFTMRWLMLFDWQQNMMVSWLCT